MDITSLGTILSIWAHPDDETYLAAGVMAAARDHGQRVVCVSATDGELGSSDPVAWPPDRLAPVRRWEAAASMAVLGIDDHRSLGLPDGALDHHEATGRAEVARLLDEVRPDTVLTFDGDGMTYHPDHIAVHRWTTAAWEATGRSARLLYAVPTVEHLAEFRDLYEEWDMYMAEARPIGVAEAELALHVRLEGRHLDRKVTALRAIASQTTDVHQLVGAEVYARQVAEEAFVDAAPILDRLTATRRSSRSAAPV